MKQKTKNIIKYSVLGLLLLLLVLFLFKIPVIPVSNGSISTGGSSSGGSSSTPTDDGSDDDLIFVPLGDLFEWFNPIEDITEDSTNLWDNFIDVFTLNENGDDCSSDGQCLSGYCDLVTYATGGRCSEPIETEEREPIIECVDSDMIRGGITLNYDVKGRCTSSTVRQGNDYCLRDNLVEYYCDNGECKTKEVMCSTVSGRNSFCYDGVCTTLA